jgi:hypothetical protein
METKTLLIVSIALLAVIVVLIYSLLQAQVKPLPSKSNWYLFGSKFCKEIKDKPENITNRFLCEGNKMIDIYDDEGVPRGILYSNEAKIDENKAIEITNYFLDFLKNEKFGCKLQKIEFYDQYKANLTYGWNLTKCAEPPWYAYFILYNCNVFNISVTVSADGECDIIGKVFAFFSFDRDKLRDFAKLVSDCNCYYFEPSIFNCKKFKLFEDRIDFMECNQPVRGIIYTFRATPNRMVFVGGGGVYVQ